MVETAKVVYKYAVACRNHWTKLALPKGAVLLSALESRPPRANYGIVIYAEVDPSQNSKEMYEFIGIGTGKEFEKRSTDVFLNTVRIPEFNGAYHVYYRKV